LHRIESSTLAVDVLPEVGGKIGQIRDKVSGRELLVPPQRPYRTIPVDGDWLKHDTSGIDDCFPNVAAGPYPEPPWTTRYLPDLGEWTHGAWEVTKTEQRELVMTRIGNALPYFAVKAVRFIDNQTLEFSYSVENRGRFPIRYLWSAHPLISVEEKYDLQLPAGNLSMQIFPPDTRSHKWPIFKSTNLSSEWIPHGTNLKVFVTGLTEGSCALRLPTHTLTFTFDLHTIPVVGIWFNNFGFPSGSERPFRCIAIEPCTSPSDLLDDLGVDAYPRIAPDDTVRWTMQLCISPH
jgi:hypothetical protein